jgi:hypothetical protein
MCYGILFYPSNDASYLIGEHMNDFDKVVELNLEFNNTKWMNKKTKDIYYLKNIVFDATNAREGTPVAIYTKDHYTKDDNLFFTRDFVEFLVKFKKEK